VADSGDGRCDDQRRASSAEYAEDNKELPVLCTLLGMEPNCDTLGEEYIREHIPMSIMLAISNKLPNRTRSLGPLASNTGPIWMLQKKVRKIYTLKIHPMELSL
jgi:hypothetical protein